MASISKLNLLLFNLLFFAAFVSSADQEDCVYTMYVRTGSMLGAGTDAKISLTVADNSGQALKINDLKAWGGLMGGSYNYFENDNLDIFSGKAPCLAGNVCKMNITSNNKGLLSPDWYCRYVEVTTTGAQTPCAQQTFTIEQWLSTTRDPKQLYATKDYCGLSSSTGVQRLMIADPENESASASS